jgi:uncharacterized phage-like protein YoqJ
VDYRSYFDYIESVNDYITEEADKTEEKIKTCCFTGHRHKALPWGSDESDLRCAAFKSNMRFTVENLIVESGYKKFISGMAMGADTICAEIVLMLKNIYPHIHLECAVPNYVFAESWAVEDIRRYSSILTRADDINFMNESKLYSKRDLIERNKYMVDSSELVIAVYIDGEMGGTKNTIDYARYRNKEVIVVEP